MVDRSLKKEPWMDVYVCVCVCISSVMTIPEKPNHVKPDVKSEYHIMHPDLSFVDNAMF
jgi:hypothetical protein